MPRPERRSVLMGHLPPARAGAAVRVAELSLDAVEAVGGKGHGAAIREASAVGLGLTLPDQSSWREAGELTALGIGPDHWMVLAAPAEPAALEARIARMLGSTASVVETGHGLVFLSLSGDQAAEALARICRLDLHPAVFGPQACARTLMAQTPVTIWRQDALSFALAAPLTLAQSFVHALALAARSVGGLAGVSEESVS